MAVFHVLLFSAFTLPIYRYLCCSLQIFPNLYMYKANSFNKTGGHSNFTKGPHRRRTCTAQLYSPLARWYQCDTLSNMLPSAHPTQHPKRHLDRFSHFHTAYGRQYLYFIPGRLFPPPKIAPSDGGLDQSNTSFLHPTRVHNTDGIPIGWTIFFSLKIMTNDLPM